MKLRSTGKPSPQELIERDMYHTCRWCKWGKFVDCDFRCTNPAYSGVAEPWVYKVTEEGYLSDTLNEALHSVPKADKKFEANLVEMLQRFGVSAKRQKEFRQVFAECLAEYLDMDIKATLDEHISKLYSNQEESAQEEFQGVIIADPHTFYCKEFW